VQVIKEGAGEIGSHHQTDRHIHAMRDQIHDDGIGRDDQQSESDGFDEGTLILDVDWHISVF
jgi:hypothetical protein